MPSLPDYVYKVLDKDFAHKSFKPHQADAVLRVCSGLSTLVVLSTGYGKSLIYQMAARLYAKKYPGAVVLVISPLISLMQDQLHNLCMFTLKLEILYRTYSYIRILNHLNISEKKNHILEREKELNKFFYTQTYIRI